ncbi:MAG: chemotaxis protein CheA [Desulfosarcinaceae bacterium]
MMKQSIRVEAGKIDYLMNQVGELVVNRAGFAQIFSEMRELQLYLKQTQKLDKKEMQFVKELTNRISDATLALGRVTAELQENVMKVRMLPIAQLFSRYPRLVHDLVRNTQKKVTLDVRGEDTELDKMVIEQIADPMVHIIRNAVDHGIEVSKERQKRGKPETGTLRLEAYHEGNYVVIEISDDGRGIDLDKVRQTALKNGFATPEELEEMGEQEILSLIMRPGFSTAREITHTSGRGVGMDVVKDHIEKLSGTINIYNTPGAGVRIRIKIPLTLAIIPALMVTVSNEIFTIPLAAVDETIRVSHDEISTIEGLEVVYLRDATIPLIRLEEVFKMDSGSHSDELFVVIVNTGSKKVGFIVDQLRGREEVVIKPLEDYLQEKSGFSGATILGDGSISLILDVFELVNLSVNQHSNKLKVAAV